MKRWRTAIVLLIVTGVTAYVLYRVFEKRAQEKREVFYQAELRSYSDALKPGMSRRQVEDFLTSKGNNFQQMCCIDWKAAHALDDLIKIGEEDPPWYCSKLNIYIGFQFAPHQQSPGSTESRGDPRDTLTQVEIFRWLEGCL